MDFADSQTLKTRDKQSDDSGVNSYYLANVDVTENGNERTIHRIYLDNPDQPVADAVAYESFDGDPEWDGSQWVFSDTLSVGCFVARPIPIEAVQLLLDVFGDSTPDQKMLDRVTQLQEQRPNTG
jgi:hypothetical protein